MTQDRQPQPPFCLLIPGRHHPRGERWQTRLVRHRDDCAILETGADLPPLRNLWLGRIDQAVAAAGRPVILAGEGLGALAIVWWAALLGRAAARRVSGALLYLPADPEGPRVAAELESFAPLPTAMLPFPSIVVAAEEHREVSAERHRDMAAHWVSDFVQLARGNDFVRSGGRSADQFVDLLVAGGPGLSRYTYRAEPLAKPRARRELPPLHIAPIT